MEEIKRQLSIQKSQTNKSLEIITRDIINTYSETHAMITYCNLQVWSDQIKSVVDEEVSKPSKKFLDCINIKKVNLARRLSNKQREKFLEILSDILPKHLYDELKSVVHDIYSALKTGNRTTRIHSSRFKTKETNPDRFEPKTDPSEIIRGFYGPSYTFKNKKAETKTVNDGKVKGEFYNYYENQDELTEEELLQVALMESLMDNSDSNNNNNNVYIKEGKMEKPLNDKNVTKYLQAKKSLESQLEMLQYYYEKSTNREREEKRLDEKIAEVLQELSNLNV
jgi:hypothetical protein